MVLNEQNLLWNSPIKSADKTPLVQLCLQAGKPGLVPVYQGAQRELHEGWEQVWAPWV